MLSLESPVKSQRDAAVTLRLEAFECRLPRQVNQSAAGITGVAAKGRKTNSHRGKGASVLVLLSTHDILDGRLMHRCARIGLRVQRCSLLAKSRHKRLRRATACEWIAELSGVLTGTRGCDRRNVGHRLGAHRSRLTRTHERWCSRGLGFLRGCGVSGSCLIQVVISTFLSSAIPSRQLSFSEMLTVLPVSFAASSMAYCALAGPRDRSM
jgi:hypothetical protein